MASAPSQRARGRRLLLSGKPSASKLLPEQLASGWHPVRFESRDGSVRGSLRLEPLIQWVCPNHDVSHRGGLVHGMQFGAPEKIVPGVAASLRRHFAKFHPDVSPEPAIACIPTPCSIPDTPEV